jgi:transposase-like protein
MASAAAGDFMFEPPRCPNVECEHHRAPERGFFIRRGSYTTRCRFESVPRYRCRSCRINFSRQTFRSDRYDRRPDLNGPLFLLLCSGVGLRQVARLLHVDPHTVQSKMRKMAKTLGPLHEHLCPRLPEGRTLVLDEEETYEAASIRPLTMPVLIEQRTWFVVATGVGTIRRLARVGSDRRRRQQFDELARGRRQDQSRECTRRVLLQLARLQPTGEVTLRSDDKAMYGVLVREIFGERMRHETTPGTRVRDKYNPLFAINVTLAMTRDLCGRLRRKSWLVTKKADCLQDHLHVFTIYRNYVRRRFNYDEETETPAKLLGLLPRNLHAHEVLAWRQDWGERSIHPMSHSGSHTVRDPVAA